MKAIGRVLHPCKFSNISCLNRGSNRYIVKTNRGSVISAAYHV